MLGYESEQLPPHIDPWTDLIHPDDKEKALKANTDCIENRCNQFQVEFRMRTKNGDWYWILRKGKAVERDKTGKATRMVGTHRNITDRKMAEDALLQSESDLKASQRIAHLGSWRLDVKTNEVFWTEELYKMYGFDPALPPPPYTEHMKLFAPKSWELLSASLEKTKETGIPYELELEMVREDESHGWMWVRGEAVQDSSGSTIGLWGAAQDISERKRNEEKLNLQSEIINRMSEGVSLVNEECIIVYANPAFERMFGYESGEMTGLHVSILNAPTTKRPEQIADDILRTLNSSGQWSGEIQNVKKDKTLFWSAAKVTILDHPKYGKAFITVQTDISELKKARDEKRILAAQLRQGQKMDSIGNLAGGIAHDFNNLLSPIIGMSEMLLEDLPEDSLEYGNAKEIFNAGKRAGDLVKQILAFSRQSEHKKMPVRIQNVLQEVLKLSRSIIPSNIDIQNNIFQNCGVILADATQMHQVIMNLITNASHAVEAKNGVINIELEEIALKNRAITDFSGLVPGKYAKLSITDNGVGIPQSHFDRIFDPYFTTKEKGKGTGLGLSVVYGIVKDHDGDIKVLSEQGKGTTFEVYLPLMKKFQEAETADNHIGISGGTERILLVDDEVSVAKLEGQMLSRLGYQVTVETNSVGALNTFKASPDSFDVVISDMTMPNMTGDQLAQELLSLKPGLPIILCTGFSERMDEETAGSIGVKGFLMKPVVKSDLAQMIRNVLDESKGIKGS
jgi:PAS domain S-box-containing protein